MNGERRVPHPFGIGDPRGYGDDEICRSAETFDDAVRIWEKLREAEPDVGFYITGWNHGVLAHPHEIEDLFAQPRGTFACPICLLETPHTHTQEEIAADREAEAELQEMRQERREEILRRVQSVMDNHALPRKIQPGDIGL